MKTLFLKSAFAVLGILPFISGCTQPSRNAAVPVSQQVVAESTPPPAPVLSEPVARPEPAPGTPPQAPPLILQGSSVFAELTKLAQSGVDEAVMISYITNSSQSFNATADQIVYLNDLGVSSGVITTMMDHDQKQKQFWAANNTPPPAVQAAVAPSTNETVAAAPAYVNAPQPVVVESVPQQPVTVVNNNYFNETLSPYGTWIEVEGYGRCWQPTVVVVNRGWRPYCDNGRWVNSDAGWYWLSDYSWGATTFHYGRWFSHPRWGWCWWPDTVWASSWVSWRYSDEYCGWAPLPPYSGYVSGVGFTYYGRAVHSSFDWHIGIGWFNYVSWNRFCEPRPRRYCVPPTQVTHIHKSTTIVNNYNSSGNARLGNIGIAPKRVSELAKTEIKTVRVRENDRPHPLGRRETLSPDDNTINVTRMPGVRSGNEKSASPLSRNLAPSVETPSASVSPRASDNRTTSVGRNDDLRGNRNGKSDGQKPVVPVTRQAGPAPAPMPIQPEVVNQDQRQKSTPRVVGIERTPNATADRERDNTPKPATQTPSETKRSPLVIDMRNRNQTQTQQFAPEQRQTTPATVIGRDSSGKGRDSGSSSRDYVVTQTQNTAPQPAPVPTITPGRSLSTPSPVVGSTRTWSQPQPQVQQRQESPRIEVPRRETVQPVIRNVERPAAREIQVRSTPAPSAAPAPRMSAPAQPSPQPSAAPVRSESRSSESRSSKSSSGSNNSESGNSRKVR